MWSTKSQLRVDHCMYVWFKKINRSLLLQHTVHHHNVSSLTGEVVDQSPSQLYVVSPLSLISLGSSSKSTEAVLTAVLPFSVVDITIEVFVSPSTVPLNFLGQFPFVDGTVDIDQFSSPHLVVDEETLEFSSRSEVILAVARPLTVLIFTTVDVAVRINDLREATKFVVEPLACYLEVFGLKNTLS